MSVLATKGTERVDGERERGEKNFDMHKNVYLQERVWEGWRTGSGKRRWKRDDGNERASERDLN